MKRLVFCRWSFHSPLNPAVVSGRIHAKLTQQRVVKPEMFRGKKGFIQVVGTTYRGFVRGDQFVLKVRPITGGSGQNLFTVRGIVKESPEGSKVSIEIPYNIGLAVFFTLWFGISLFAGIWNVYQSIVSGELKFEMGLALLLIAVGIGALFLFRSNLRKNIKEFKSTFLTLLEAEE